MTVPAKAPGRAPSSLGRVGMDHTRGGHKPGGANTGRNIQQAVTGRRPLWGAELMFLLWATTTLPDAWWKVRLLYLSFRDKLGSQLMKQLFPHSCSRVEDEGPLFGSQTG